MRFHTREHLWLKRREGKKVKPSPWRCVFSTTERLPNKVPWKRVDVLRETWTLEWIRKNFSVEWFVFLLLLLFLHIIPLFLPKLFWRMGIVEKAVGPIAVPWSARAYNCKKCPCVKTMSATGTPEICANVVCFDFKRDVQFCRVQF